MIDKNILGIEPDFSKDSNYNPNTNVSQVKFGADAPVLEVELNELQQVQNKAREDLVKSMIPSGFTVVPKIDFSKSTLTTIVTANDAEAYVNGMRIFIPKGTVIDIGESPKQTSREDLIFLEVWKEEVNPKSELTEYSGEGQKPIENNLIDPRVRVETSRRIINKWRIRHVADVDFSINPLGLRKGGTAWKDCKAIAQGGNSSVPEPITDLAYCVLSSCAVNFDNKTRNWSNYDSGLYIAGKGDSFGGNILKTLDGYVYAIPMFKIQRRPSSGFRRGDYNNIAPITDPIKVANVLNNEKVAGVSTGEVDMLVEGRTFFNVFKVENKDFIIDKAVSTDSRIQKFSLNHKIPANTKCTLVLDVSKYEMEGSSVGLRMYCISDGSGGQDYQTIATNKGRIVHHFTTKDYVTIQLYIYIEGVDFDAGKKVTFTNPMLFIGDIKDVPSKFVSDFESTGEREVAFKEYLDYPCSAISGSANADIATFAYKPECNLVQIVPVDINGNEIRNVNLGYMLQNDTDENLGGETTLKSTKITDDVKSKITKIKIYGNTSTSSYSIKGFNIYDGYAVSYKAKVSDDKESLMEFRLKKPLKGIPNGVKDSITRDGILIPRVKSIVLKASEDENWKKYVTQAEGFFTAILLGRNDIIESPVLCNRLVYNDKTWKSDFTSEGIQMSTTNGEPALYVKVESSKLSSQDIEGFKAWLKANPLTVYYGDKLFEPLLELPNGVADIDNEIGEVTRNVKKLKLNGSESWSTGLESSGWSPQVNTIPFFIYTPDLASEDITLSPNMNKLSSIPVNDAEGYGAVKNAQPYIAIRVLKSKLETLDVAGFKKWLGQNNKTVLYSTTSTSVDNYKAEKVEVIGDLYFNDTNTQVISNNSIPAKLSLSHKADVSLALYEESTNILSLNKMSPKITCGETSGDYNVHLAPLKDVENTSVKLEGITLKNILTPYIGTSLSSSKYLGDGVYEMARDVYDNRFMVTNAEKVYKPDTQYTLILDIIENNYNSDLGLGTGSVSPFKSHNYQGEIKAKSTGIFKFLLTTLDADNLKGKDVLWLTGAIGTGTIRLRFMVLEGDYTNKNEPPFFLGVQSVGDAEKNILDILSHGKNIFDINRDYPNSSNACSLNKNIEENSLVLEQRLQGTYCYAGFWMEVEPNTDYVFSAKFDNNDYECGVRVLTPDSSVSVWLTGSTRVNTFNSKNNNRIRLLLYTATEVQAPKGTTLTIRDLFLARGKDLDMPFEKYKGVHKQLNIPVQDGFKGIPNSVRDTIEERKDGDYYIQKVMKVVLDGSEQWTDNGTNSNSDFLLTFTPSYQREIVGRVVCDKITEYENVNQFMNKSQGICQSSGAGGILYLSVKKSDLDTPDVGGLKRWLRKNPVTVYYQLAKPIEYKLTSNLVTEETSSTFALEGQVDYKRAWDGGANITKVSLTPVNPYSTWLDPNQTRLFKYKLIDKASSLELLNVPIAPCSDDLEGEKSLNQYKLSIVKLLPDNMCLVRCNSGGRVGGKAEESFIVPTQYSCKTFSGDIESICSRVSLTGWDYNQVLEEELYKLLK